MTQYCVQNHPPSTSRIDPNQAKQSTTCMNYVRKLRWYGITYYHAAAGFPTKVTWLKAIANNHYASWPGLSTKAVRDHFPESEETPKGHMKKQKSGIRSTKTTTRPEKKQKDIMVKVIDTHDELAYKIYTDQTGRFPTKSSRGYQYIMVLSEVDSDAILIEPMRNRTAGEMVKTYQTLIDRLNKCGIYPKHQILDNKISAEYQKAIEKNKMTFQKVPPHDHRRNLAERAIQTFKAHFIAILCGVDESFPMHLWCRILPQVEMTLNLLRPSRLLPTVSAHAHLYGQHDYNAHPLAPLGYNAVLILLKYHTFEFIFLSALNREYGSYVRTPYV